MDNITQAVTARLEGDLCEFCPQCVSPDWQVYEWEIKAMRHDMLPECYVKLRCLACGAQDEIHTTPDTQVTVGLAHGEITVGTRRFRSWITSIT